MTFLSIKAKEKNINLVLDNDTQICDFLIGDPFRLNQILLNLLTNALKFTDSGTITLRTHLEYENDIENKIKIEVSDTGIGIDSKKINSIFESYTQEDISITRKYGGTGLGLTITKQLVELFGGEISVFSNKISGTTFIITLLFKRSKKTDSKKIEPVIDPQSLKGIKVLLAEDNELNQVIALTYLNRWEIETDTVLNGLEAIVNVKNKKYDIILMDIQMPEMDGITATKIIRYELLSKTPIIALTAHALNDEREKYMQAGFDEYVTKPIDENILLTSLLKHIEPSLPNNYIHLESKITQNNNLIEEPIFNLSELKKIAINDNQFIPKILQLFINQSIEIPGKLKIFIENKDIAEIGFTIHQIKPSLHHLSVDCTKDIIRKIEENIHDNKNEEETLQLAIQIIPILDTLLEQLNNELEKYNTFI
jgi:CheY-like chemotaxis protein/anti-sigma regulatory factor (Ser/Thr protein kinase)